MAKKSAIEKNDKRRRLVAKFAGKRAALRAMAKDASLPPEERFKARLKLNELPKNGAATRVRNRCAVSGRPRGYYRKFGILAHCAEGARLEGPAAGRRQIELVGGGPWR